MLDIKFIRENKSKVRDSLKRRRMDVSLVDKVLLLDENKRSQMAEVQDLRTQMNAVAKEGGNKESRKKGKELKSRLKSLEPALAKIEKDYKKAIWALPNLLHKDVPDGKDDTENEVIKTWGKPTKFGFKPKDHVELGEALGIIDTKTSAKVSGSRFAYLKGDAVLLQFALIQFVLTTLTDKKIIAKIAKDVDNPNDTPFTPVVPPVIAKAQVMKKMDRHDPIDDRYYLEKDDALLIGSAEHTLGPMHMDEMLAEKNLPIRYLGYSTAFRREAGTYGKYAKGLYRLHQFDKLEMETFAAKENGEAEQRLMTGIQEYLMQQLEIPYQVIAICAGDIGKPDFLQIDIEAWMPGKDGYGETHTSDYMTDFQSRRLNIRYVGKGGAKEYVHMNDATAFAIGRAIIAIVENYQQKNGSVAVPKVLRKWIGKDKIVGSR